MDRAVTGLPREVIASSGLEQRLGLFDATMLVTGSMIGSGIFLVSAEISRDTGGAGWLLLVWALSGVMTVLGALAYAELAAMMPRAGGQYVYLREAFNPLAGFLYGWTSFLVIQTGTIAAVAVAFAKFLGVLVPALGTRDARIADFAQDPAVLFGVGGLNLNVSLPLPWLAKPLTIFHREEFTISRGQLVGLGVIAVLSWWNARGLARGKWLQNVFTVAKIGTLLALIGVGLFWTASAEIVRFNALEPWAGIFRTPAYRAAEQLVPAGGGLLAAMVVGGAMVGALFSSDAWNNVTFTAGEVRNPRRNLPGGLILGTGLVILLYLLANLAYLATLPIAEIAAAPQDRVATAVLEVASPRHGASWMALGIMVSTFGCLNGLILAGARLTYALARDGLFFARTGVLNARHVPAHALGAQAIWAGLLVFTGTYSELLDYVIFAALLFYALTVSGLFVLRWRRPDQPRPYRTLGYPLLPGLYVGLCVAIMLDLLVVKPVFTWPGLLLVLSGIPVYFLWKIRPPDVAATPGD